MSQQKQHRQDKVGMEKASRKKAAESPSIQRQKGGQAALPKEREKDVEVQRKMPGRSGARDSTRRTSEYSDDL